MFDHNHDSLIARISAAPERRVYYIDVGDMPEQKTAEYLESIKKEFAKRGIAKQLAAFRNESGADFTDISSEASRTYNFGQKGFVKITNPLYLSVSSSGGHRIFSADGQSHYIPSGWIHLSWTVHEGNPNFVK